MNVLILAVVLDGWEVEVDDVHNVADVEATSRHTGSDHDGSLACLESTSALVSVKWVEGKDVTYRASSLSR